MDLKELEKKMKGTNYVVMTKDGMLMKYNNVGMVLGHLSNFIHAVKDDIDKDMLYDAIKLGFKSDEELSKEYKKQKEELSKEYKKQKEINSKLDKLMDELHELFKGED